MTQDKSSKPNPSLKTWEVLVGTWNTVGTHRLLPGKTLHGRATFKWLEGGAFLAMRSETDEEDIPDANAIFGSDNEAKRVFLIYYDERGVSRIFEANFDGRVLKYWRDFPGFSQRFTGTLSNDGNTIEGVSELAEDDGIWKKDLVLTFSRTKQ